MVRIEKPEDYRFVRFQRSQSKGKKYDAILIHKRTNKPKAVPFGSILHQQYKDTTGLGLYSHLDHNDPKRRALYRKRHAGEDGYKYSSGYWSYKYLW